MIISIFKDNQDFEIRCIKHQQLKNLIVKTELSSVKFNLYCIKHMQMFMFTKKPVMEFVTSY